MLSLVHKKPGEAVVFDLPIPEPVEVIYNPTADQYGGQICTVEGGVLQCKAEYTHRVSLSHSALKLLDANLSDSGVYIVKDMRNNEVIHMYTIAVEGRYQCDLCLLILTNNITKTLPSLGHGKKLVIIDNQITCILSAMLDMYNA